MTLQTLSAPQLRDSGAATTDRFLGLLKGGHAPAAPSLLRVGLERLPGFVVWLSSRSRHASAPRQAQEEAAALALHGGYS